MTCGGALKKRPGHTVSRHDVGCHGDTCCCACHGAAHRVVLSRNGSKQQKRGWARRTVCTFLSRVSIPEDHMLGTDLNDSKHKSCLSPVPASMCVRRQRAGARRTPRYAVPYKCVCVHGKQMFVCMCTHRGEQCGCQAGSHDPAGGRRAAGEIRPSRRLSVRARRHACT